VRKEHPAQDRAQDSQEASHGKGHEKLLHDPRPGSCGGRIQNPSRLPSRWRLQYFPGLPPLQPALQRGVEADFPAGLGNILEKDEEDLAQLDSISILEDGLSSQRAVDEHPASFGKVPEKVALSLAGEEDFGRSQ
jgi:hypothetical protein